ncbi:ASCH domain-containing protein [Solibaculum mannosilyticum]|uniref:ASCH domain-containing protein n=1 Tax=Solibaculum mannosilyticum TaxID=2780922 RepID=UPI0007A859E7|nr:hypothetical protein BN3661_02093 [Eubacteriaceae bacterium CHKCI005]
MKALSLHPYWAMKFLIGEKSVECRSWKTSYRGDILICASAKKEVGCISGMGLLIGKLVDIVPFEKKHLADSCMDELPENPSYAWIFDDFRVIYPIPIKGKLSLFEVDVPLQILPDDITDEEISDIFNPLIVV